MRSLLWRTARGSALLQLSKRFLSCNLYLPWRDILPHSLQCALGRNKNFCECLILTNNLNLLAEKCLYSFPFSAFLLLTGVPTGRSSCSAESACPALRQECPLCFEKARHAQPPLKPLVQNSAELVFHFSLACRPVKSSCSAESACLMPGSAPGIHSLLSQAQTSRRLCRRSPGKSSAVLEGSSPQLSAIPMQPPSSWCLQARDLHATKGRALSSQSTASASSPGARGARTSLPTCTRRTAMLGSLQEYQAKSCGVMSRASHRVPWCTRSTSRTTCMRRKASLMSCTV